jgi:hypothetical protein
VTALALLLRRVPGIAWVIALVVLLVASFGLTLAAHERAVGRETERATALTVKTVHDSIAVVIHDTIVLRDTAVLTRWVTRFDTVRTTLDVRDTNAVKAFVAVADSTVHQCRQTVRDLALSCAAKDTVIRDLRGLLALRVPESHPFTGKQRVEAAVLGAVVAEVARAFLVRH